MNVSNLLSTGGLLNTFLLLCTLVGGFFAFRRGASNQQLTSMKDTIDILQSQIEAVQSSLAAVEKENQHLKRMLETIQLALSQRGTQVTIDGDLVTIVESNGEKSSVMRKHDSGNIPAVKPPMRKRRTLHSAALQKPTGDTNA